MTLGQKINHAAKAVAALLIAVVSMFTALMATLPASMPDSVAQYAVWVQTALAFLTAAAVWLTANGPKVGAAVDTIDAIQDTFGDVVEEAKGWLPESRADQQQRDY